MPLAMGQGEVTKMLVSRISITLAAFVFLTAPLDARQTEVSLRHRTLFEDPLKLKIDSTDNVVEFQAFFDRSFKNRKMVLEKNSSVVAPLFKNVLIRSEPKLNTFQIYFDILYWFSVKMNSR